MPHSFLVMEFRYLFSITKTVQASQGEEMQTTWGSFPNWWCQTKSQAKLELCMSSGKTNAKTSDLGDTAGIQASIFCVWGDEKPMASVFSIWAEKTDLQSYQSRVSDAAALFMKTCYA